MDFLRSKAGFCHIVSLSILAFHLFSEQIPADCHEFSIGLKKNALGNGLSLEQYQKNLRLCRTGRAEAATSL